MFAYRWSDHGAFEKIVANFTSNNNIIIGFPLNIFRRTLWERYKGPHHGALFLRGVDLWKQSFEFVKDRSLTKTLGC
jgi:hypothetical protein